MFLSETQPFIAEFPKEKPLLKYKWSSTIIPEYEFQKFLVREFSKISKGIWYAWQYGLYFNCYDLQIYIQLINDGIILEIWSQDVIKCGKYLQWMRNAILSTASESFFNEYILVENESGQALLPYHTLEILNSWNIIFYCLPKQDDYAILIPIDIEIISQKCGLKGKNLRNESIDINLLIKTKLERGGAIMNFNIENMYGDLKNYEAQGENATIIVSENNTDVALTQAISDLKTKIDLVGNDCNDLKVILEELEKSKAEDRTSIKNRINKWMSQSANIITIGSALYDNKQAIFDGVQQILNLL